jgi:hypothetical protein
VSPLTKIFVMLLVVTSLLNAAATVVYVNKAQLVDQDAKALASANNALNVEKQQAIQDAQTARAQLSAQEQLAATEAATKQTALDKAEADLAAKDADNNLLLRNNETLNANLQGLNAQLAIALSANKQDDQTLADLRDTNNKLVQSQAENDAGLARQRQLADTYGRQVEYLTEQMKKSDDLIKAYSTVINEHHLTVPANQPTSYNGPPVSGVVQDKQNINGVTYLTISVGSADNVQPGMQFRVVDAQQQKFLGIMTVTQADVNTSVGRIQAAGTIDQVGPGDEVTSDFQ